MKQPTYRERDYGFGQSMLSLRAAIGLTQAGLADFLGVSRRAVGEWEAGSSYPKTEHLKKLITLAVQHQGFHAGREAEQIRELWAGAHQKVMLNEAWLAGLLAVSVSISVKPATVEVGTGAARPVTPPPARPRVDWGEAYAVPAFYGRDWEQSLLTEWVVEQRCRVVSVLGLGGIGKSALTVWLMKEVAEQFDVVIWRSLRDAPACEVLLDDCLQVLAPQPLGTVASGLEQRLRLLIDTMRSQRTLLVLDNLETLLEDGDSAGRMRPGYEGYGRLLRWVAETEHQSCLLLTSREKLSALVPLEGNQSPVRTLRLARLDADSCGKLLSEKGVIGVASDNARLIEAYGGNALALKIVAQTIVELFDGETAPFLEQGEIIFGGVRDLLNEQFARLSAIEQSVLLWLAILREPSTLDDLLAALVTPTPRSRLLEALDALHRRSLIERGQKPGTFTLQSVVLEYLTVKLIADAFDELQEGRQSRLVQHGFELAHSKDYVRQSQERLLVAPLLDRLLQTHSDIQLLIQTCLDEIRTWPAHIQGYAPANLIALLRLYRGNLRGFDFSQLALRSVYLQGIEMQDARLVNATIHNGSFTEVFDAMTGVAISRTGEYWAASSRRGELRIWAAGGHVLRHAWRGHTDMAWALAFSPDGQILASGSNDGTLKLWDAASGTFLWSGRHTSIVNDLAFTANGLILASAGNDATVNLWDVASGTLLQSLLHPNAVLSVVWSPDGKLLASGDMKGCVRLWTMNQTEPTPRVLALTEHTNCVNGLAVSPDGRFLASGSWDGTVKLWEIPGGRLLQTITGHTDIVTRVAWSPDGHTVASSSDDQTILLWDVENDRYRAVLRGHTADVYELAFTPDNLSLLSGSKDGTLRVWDVGSERCVRVISGYATSIYDVDWSPDGRQLVSGGTDLVPTIWNVTERTPLRVLQEHIGIVCGVGWSADGRWLASSESKHAIRLWDLTSSADFKFLRQPDSGGNYLYGLAWSPNGQHLASGTHLGGVMIWDAISGYQEWIGRQLSVRFPQVAWSPDGLRLAGGGDDGIVYIWNVRQGSLEQQLIGHHSRIRSLAWSPDGTRLASGASGAEDGELFVWDTQRGNRLYSLTGHRGVVSAVAWDSSRDYLISGDGYGHIHWWDVQRGEQLWVREAHEGTVQSVRRSPDGTMVASCGDDGAIMLWAMHTGEYLQTLRRDRPYERLDITGIRGLTDVQKATLRALGAIET